MPRYLIHVGPHKTGTTYLQYVFAAVRQRLLERRVVYPAEWSAAATEPSHRKLFLNIRDANLRYLSARFEDMTRNGAEYVLLSSEDFGHLQLPQLQSFRQLLDDNPATIIFYCRRWSELLPSLWQERVKHGYHEELLEFLARNINDPFNSPLMNFSIPLDRYASVFGRENVRIVSYSNACDAKTDLAEHFFATFLPNCRGVLKELPPLNNPRPNVSLPPLDTEAIRALNSIHSANGGTKSAELRVWYMSQGRRADLANLFGAMNSNMGSIQFSDASPTLEGLHQGIAGTYGDVLVEPVHQGKLFEPHVNVIPFVQSSYLADASAHSVLEELYARFLAARG